MKTEAAVLVQTGKPLELVDIEIPKLKPGQVLVEIHYSGVCHTQILEARGYRGEDKFLPHCLGHEGSGVVREVGEGVKKVKPDDRVLISWIKGTGGDVPGTQYTWNGKTVNAGGVTTFSKMSVISENRLTVLSDDMKLKDVVLIGCAVPTGVGSLINTAQARPGRSFALFGAGGVGLCALMGAEICGLTPKVVVDVNPGKFDLAKKLGATHCIDASKGDAVAEIKRVVPQGIDYAVEASGHPTAMKQALECLRHQGGVAVIIGNARFGSMVELNPRELNMGKKLMGTWGGDNKPDEDYPRYLKLLKAGKLKLDLLTNKQYSLQDINKALDDLEAGNAIRPLIKISA